MHSRGVQQRPPTPLTTRQSNTPKSRRLRTTEPPRDPFALLSAPDVERLLGIDRMTLYRWTMDGVFPPPDKLLPGKPPRKAWLRSTFEAWCTNNPVPSTWT